MDELLTQFLIEGRDLVAQAEADLGLLAHDAGDARALDSLFRALHTLKGSVGLFDMAPVEALLHQAEDQLTAVRSTRLSLGPNLIDALLACVDEVDRWIDQLERDGRIGDDASERATRLAAGLSEAAGDGEAAGGAPGATAGPVLDEGEEHVPDWVTAIQQRAAPVLAAAEGPMVAFLYTPDSDCFFRGDDPLGVAAAVPGLADLAILPQAQAPSLATWDPFRCHVRLEGLSTESLETVRAAFRLVADQVSFALVVLDPDTSAVPAEARDGARSLRVDGARLDALAGDVGDLVVAANGLAHAVRLAGEADPGLAVALRRLQGEIDRIAGRLHHSVAQVRRVPLAATVRRLPRLVREISQGLGKSVRFTMRGEGIEVDKAIADGLFEPLLHLIRNALDHGLEDNATRVAAGKAEEGSLELRIAREGDEVVLSVSDDGAGIDPSRIRELAVTRGLITTDAAAALTDPQALRLILLPGFSTAATVSELSGRGVGMDAVQSAVDRLRGRIVVTSKPGAGSSIALRLPLDAITTRLLLVRAGTERYGVPLDQIVETVRVATSEIVPLGSGHACILRDETVPVLDLGSLLGGASAAGAAARLVVTECAGARVALRVDGFETQIDALVRETSGLLAGLPGVAGTALMGDGAVLLVLDLPELAA